MGDTRKEMTDALKTIVIPRLRESGFKGSFPHFRRQTESVVDLLTFQFDKWGGGFVIEISQCPAEGITTSWGEHILPNKVTTHDLHPDIRLRLHPVEGSSRDEWFRYDEGNFKGTAESVLPFIDVAEGWWQQKRGGKPA
jgi:hypothetical protein